MKAAVAVLLVPIACAGAGGTPPPPSPLTAEELPRLSDVPNSLRPLASDYRPGSALLAGARSWDAGDAQTAARQLERARRAPDASPAAWSLHAWTLFDAAGAHAAAAVAAEGVALHPDHGGTRAVLVDALLREGRLADATRELQPLTEQPVPDGYVLGLAARLASSQGEHGEALHHLDRLAIGGPMDPPMMRLRARTLESLDRSAEALPLYEQLAAGDPDDPVLLEEMALAALRAALTTEAVPHFARAEVLLRQVATLDPQHAEAHAGLGVCARQRGDDAAAEAAWWRALELRPADAESALALAELLRASGRGLDADRLLREVLRQPLDAAAGGSVRAALEDEEIHS